MTVLHENGHFSYNLEMELVTPVSYTHLDVYKRQEVCLSNVKSTLHLSEKTQEGTLCLKM